MARPVPPPTEVSERVRTLVDQTSIAEAARRLNMAEATVARLAGGLKVTPGTTLLAQQRLAQEEASA
jgi:hypothetical protein